MGNKLKSPKVNPDPDVFTEEKPEEVAIKELVRDKRTHKIFGAFLVFICFFLLIAFGSYLFTWTADQDKVRDTGIKILLPNELEITNLFGSLGAYTAFIFFEYGFGIASFFFCMLFFVLGINLLFDRKVYSLWRSIRYMILGLVIVSVSASYFTGLSAFNWGGAFGQYSSTWMNAVIGKIGTFAVLVTALFAYFIKSVITIRNF
jgi:S-DNA-T family DNA segregation ATPase FtsK/SpoIIIE